MARKNFYISLMILTLAFTTLGCITNETKMEVAVQATRVKPDTVMVYVSTRRRARISRIATDNMVKSD